MRINTIQIDLIDHNDHRYSTVGDYWFNKENKTLFIRVSRMKNNLHSLLIAFHELAEAIQINHNGIPEPEIMEFDVKFEQERDLGKHSMEDEPGDDSRAPYRNEHFISTTLERILAQALGIDWAKYDKAVLELDYNPKKRR